MECMIQNKKKMIGNSLHRMIIIHLSETNDVNNKNSNGET